MRTLSEEIDELLSRAEYYEKKQPNTPITADYWTRLKSVCDQAREKCPVLVNLVPDESQQTWSEALLCLEAVNEAFRDAAPS